MKWRVVNKNIKDWSSDELFDGVLCDPPYELGFMGKSWDSSGIAYDVDMWKNIFDHLKPGAHLLAFSGSRTYHRMACAIEDAGFEIRDMIEWVYGSGFPKSLNIGKAVDKIQGNERETYLKPIAYPDSDTWGIPNHNSKGNDIGFETQGTGTRKDMDGKGNQIKTKGTSPYEGYGTALKPAHEPCVLARKPIEGTVANNALKYGTGGLNIDKSRIPTLMGKKGRHPTLFVESNPLGRFPANLIHDGSDEVEAVFPNESSRFFYCAKASKSERNAGLEGFEDRIGGGMAGTADKTLLTGSGNERNNVMKNHHPTVKPLSLTKYLATLIKPPSGGRLLVPFAGSGSEMIGALQAGWEYVEGVELTEEYIPIAEARIEYWLGQIKENDRQRRSK